jgi:hypothetical protein
MGCDPGGRAHIHGVCRAACYDPADALQGAPGV